ncbi:glycosyltransferase family 9 protein [Desulfovibrio aminophilus]|uniref:glycosyltransferase family 9 protein n=1 Tax=Desulfovibrio aminophilus TaxID=81425 RepID=UPI0005554899|nr:glycosyltransferase family 9 protein [Desulfovibrio aminophilus]
MTKPIPQDFTPRRALICQQRQIGDVILATPLIRMLKDRYPAVEIDFFTEAKCADVLKDNPDISRLWVVDKSLSPWGALAFYLNMRRRSYDLVVNCQQLPRCKTVTFFSGARYRLAHTPKWYNSFLYTHTAPIFGGYAAKVKACALSPLGLEWKGERPYVHVPEEKRAWADAWLREQGLRDGEKLVTVDTTHKAVTRRWPARHYARLFELLAEKRPELRFLLLHGPGEEGQVREVYDACGRRDRCLLLPEILPLDRVAAIQSRAVLHLGNCSAPRHLALAVGTPTFTFIGANYGPSWTYPGPDQNFAALTLDCSRCNKDVCPKGTMQCLNELTPELVLPQLLAQLPEEPPA